MMRQGAWLSILGPAAVNPAISLLLFRAWEPKDRETSPTCRVLEWELLSTRTQLSEELLQPHHAGRTRDIFVLQRASAIGQHWWLLLPGDQGINSVLWFSARSGTWR
jgi:hypothetical protein